VICPTGNAPQVPIPQGSERLGPQARADRLPSLSARRLFAVAVSPAQSTSKAEARLADLINFRMARKARSRARRGKKRVVVLGLPAQQVELDEPPHAAEMGVTIEQRSSNAFGDPSSAGVTDAAPAPAELYVYSPVAAAQLSGGTSAWAHWNLTPMVWPQPSGVVAARPQLQSTQR
jgi:hypothetical protein